MSPSAGISRKGAPAPETIAATFWEEGEQPFRKNLKLTLLLWLDRHQIHQGLLPPDLCDFGLNPSHFKFLFLAAVDSEVERDVPQIAKIRSGWRVVICFQFPYLGRFLIPRQGLHRIILRVRSISRGQKSLALTD